MKLNYTIRSNEVLTANSTYQTVRFKIVAARPYSTITLIGTAAYDSLIGRAEALVLDTDTGVVLCLNYASDAIPFTQVSLETSNTYDIKSSSRILNATEPKPSIEFHLSSPEGSALDIEVTTEPDKIGKILFQSLTLERLVDPNKKIPAVLNSKNILTIIDSGISLPVLLLPKIREIDSVQTFKMKAAEDRT